MRSLTLVVPGNHALLKLRCLGYNSGVSINFQGGAGVNRVAGTADTSIWGRMYYYQDPGRGADQQGVTKIGKLTPSPHLQFAIEHRVLAPSSSCIEALPVCGD